MQCTHMSALRAKEGHVLRRVSRIEGNEVKRDGCQESQRLDSTDEVGEGRSFGRPDGGKRDVGIMNRHQETQIDAQKST